MVKVKHEKYSYWIGFLKTVKNMAVILLPILGAGLAGVEGKYAWLAGGIAYMIKNYYESANKRALF